MRKAKPDAEYREIVFHHDDETPLDFLVGLLHSVFKKQLADVFRLTDATLREKKAVCGSYPREIADELLHAARQRIDESGYPLRITSRASGSDAEFLDVRCKLCGSLSGHNQVSLKGTLTLICDDCMNGIRTQLPGMVSNKNFNYVHHALAFHFAGIPLDRLVTTSRLFPGHMRADVQAGVDKLFSAAALRFFGVHQEYRYGHAELRGADEEWPERPCHRTGAV